nr:MAG TPA: hypothetical protein [Caudoviricetes sp.]
MRFLLAVTKRLLTFVTVKTKRRNTQQKGEKISSPELIKLRWAIFYAHITASL